MKQKYCYRVIVPSQNAINSFEVLRDKKIETRTQFNELQEVLAKNNPALNTDNAMIINLILLKNK